VGARQDERRRPSSSCGCDVAPISGVKNGGGGDEGAHACSCGSFVTWKLATVRWHRLCHAGDMACRGHVVVVAEPLACDVAVDVRRR
jgi:hypothetical protein